MPTADRVRRGFTRFGIIVFAPFILLSAYNLAYYGYLKFWSGPWAFVPTPNMFDDFDAPEKKREVEMKRADAGLSHYQSEINQAYNILIIAGGFAIAAFITIWGIGWALSGFFN